MAQFEKEILKQSEEANAQVEAIFKKFAENMHDEGGNKEGLLRQNYSKYANCFMINVHELRNLLTVDVKTWTTELVDLKAEI